MNVTHQFRLRPFLETFESENVIWIPLCAFKVLKTQYMRML